MINSPYIDPRLKIRWMPEINGRGVFSTEPIPANTIIEKSPLVVYPKNIMEMCIWLLQAEGLRSEEFILDQYAVEWGNKNQCAVPLGWAAIYNHSDNNNCEFIAYFEEKLIGIQTLRDIQVDEQCCVSYGQHWFNTKGYIKKVNF